MKNSDSALGAIAEGIVDGIESLVQEAQRATQPLELDPHRSKLFEFFVTADAAGYLSEDREPNLSSDSLCHLLAQRWGLSDAARNSVSEQTRLQPDQLDSMRMFMVRDADVDGVDVCLATLVRVSPLTRLIVTGAFR